MTKIIYQKKNVIVTGGAGFIGSHLCDSLLKEGARVICVDNFSTSSEMNIDHLLRYADFEFIRHNIVEPIDLLKLPELSKFEIKWQGIQEIYHLACPTSPKEFDKMPVETAITNGSGTKNILDLAKQYNSKFLLASSSAIYGNPVKGIDYFHESYWGFIDPLGARGCYNEGKRFAETLTSNYAHVYHLDTKIARIFNTYGPRMKIADGRLIPDFIDNAIDNKDVIIYSDPNTVSSFCYVDDVVEGLKRLLASDISEPINFGSFEEHLLEDVAKKIIAMVQSKSKITYGKPLVYMAKQGLPDISKAKELLGWIPLTSLEKGLRLTIDDMQANRILINTRTSKT